MCLFRRGPYKKRKSPSKILFLTCSIIDCIYIHDHMWSITSLGSPSWFVYKQLARKKMSFIINNYLFFNVLFLEFVLQVHHFTCRFKTCYLNELCIFNLINLLSLVKGLLSTEQYFFFLIVVVVPSYLSPSLPNSCKEALKKVREIKLFGSHGLQWGVGIMFRVCIFFQVFDEYFSEPNIAEFTHHYWRDN